MRIDKYLSKSGYGTRNEVKKIIKAKRVFVNDSLCEKIDMHIDENSDVVYVDDVLVEYEEFHYFMFHKPAGYVTTTDLTTDSIMNFIDEPYQDLFACGRLDKDTEGLLLITNDGKLSHALLAPRNHIEKEYIVRCVHELNDEDIYKIENGLIEEGGNTFMPAKIFQSDPLEYHIIICEGKFHEIKRIFLALDNEVTYLKRIRMKNLILDENIALGEYRKLTNDELENLKEVLS